MLSGCFSAFDDGRGRHSSSTSRTSRGVASRSTGQQAADDEYTVAGGDTLYAIAFRKQLDFHDLADWNRIGGPDYRIYPGRVLRLRAPGAATAVAARTDTPPPGSRDRPESAASAISGTGSVAANPASATAMPPRPAVALPPDTAPPPRLPVPPASIAVAVPRSGSGRWGRPTSGDIVRRFGADGSKGIDIGGRLGQVVVAAAAGRVVYSGSALKGYGELIIIKHDEQYLSAYGFNQRRLVNEGDSVGAGQPIAELGLGPAQKPELHFEIRDRGRPVDPVPLLAAR